MLQDTAREIFLAKQANTSRTEKWVMGNYMFFRMHRITDIYFVGGFGTVQWVDVNEYLTSTPDAIATNTPSLTLQVRYASQQQSISISTSTGVASMHGTFDPAASTSERAQQWDVCL